MHDDKSPAGESAEQPDRPELPQFTLWGLLSFFTATTVCFSLVVSGVRVNYVLPGAGKLLFGLAAVLAYFFLSVTYRRLRLTAARIAHWCGMGLGVILALTSLLGHTGGASGPKVFLPVVLLAAFLYALAGGCFYGLLFSVPVFVVTMSVALLKGAVRVFRTRATAAPGPGQFPEGVEQPADDLPGVEGDDG